MNIFAKLWHQFRMDLGRLLVAPDYVIRHKADPKFKLAAQAQAVEGETLFVDGVMYSLIRELDGSVVLFMGRTPLMSLPPPGDSYDPEPQHHRS